MTSASIVQWLGIASIIGILAYWYIREHRYSRANRSKSQHHPYIQRTIRWLPYLVAIILIAQILNMVQLDLPVSSSTARILFIAGLLVFWGAAGLAIWARQALGENWAHAADVQIITGQSLVTTGPYRFIRHPIYTAFLFMFIGIELIVVSWLLLGALPLLWLLQWQIRKEETLLQQEFGDAYRAYARRTGSLFPRW